MNSYVVITMVRKEQGQDDYFNNKAYFSNVTSQHKDIGHHQVLELQLRKMFSA